MGKINPVDRITELAEGNPGAAHFIMDIIHSNNKELIQYLGRMIGASGLKGTDLYVLYNDLADKDLFKVKEIFERVPMDVIRNASKRQDESGIPIIEKYLNDVQST